MPDLTDRQRAVKARLDQGMSARQIAEELGITRNAVYQQIQRLRRFGILEKGFTASGLPAREQQPGRDMLANLLQDSTEHERVEAAGTLALVNELRRTRDSLDAITRRLSSIVPR